jgi:hypothetical protein
MYQHRQYAAQLDYDEQHDRRPPEPPEGLFGGKRALRRLLFRAVTFHDKELSHNRVAAAKSLKAATGGPVGILLINRAALH